MNPTATLHSIITKLEHAARHPVASGAAPVFSPPLTDEVAPGKVLPSSQVGDGSQPRGNTGPTQENCHARVSRAGCTVKDRYQKTITNNYCENNETADRLCCGSIKPPGAPNKPLGAHNSPDVANAEWRAFLGRMIDERAN